MKKTVVSLLAITVVMAVSLTSGCKNPKPGVVQIPTMNPRIGQAQTTDPTLGSDSENTTSPISPSNNWSSNSGSGIPLDTPEDPSTGNNLPQVDNVPAIEEDDISPEAEKARREYFMGRPMDRDAFKAYTIHFDFDSTLVRPSDMANIQAIADYLNIHTDCALLIEGHCDERGTEEYNQSLGQRRAASALEALGKAGLNKNRAQTISYGEVRPAINAQNNEAYAANRRAEFVLLGAQTPEATLAE